jgi:hypothetical protein
MIDLAKRQLPRPRALRTQVRPTRRRAVPGRNACRHFTIYSPRRDDKPGRDGRRRVRRVPNPEEFGPATEFFDKLH